MKCKECKHSGLCVEDNRINSLIPTCYMCEHRAIEITDNPCKSCTGLLLHGGVCNFKRRTDLDE